jgi:hypothetical protein
MIVFILEQGNHKNGFKPLTLTDANGIFASVELSQAQYGYYDYPVNQWQSGEYTYVNYGHSTEFYRYKVVTLKDNTKKKEDE